ncbi:MAG: HlyD family efflux transporter periplasmic adaptor subunit [Bacteroidales bacterium]|nr:HlyD family efflux transporter periplasmic adaptor subunit [Bacteroidales bacterium]
MDLKPEEIEKIELRSTEVQEILTRPPKWIVRWGITIIFIVVLVIITGSWFFKYPDIISANIVLTTENPPAQVIAKSNGKIQNLFVSDNDVVIKDQILGVIENPADFFSIKILNEQLDNFETTFKPGSLYVINKDNFELGNIQSYYTNFFKNIETYNQMIKLDYHDQKLTLYYQEIKKYDLYLNNLETQMNLLKNDFKLTAKQFKRDSLLFTQKLISDSDYEKSRSQLIAKQYSFEQINSSIASTNLQIESLNQSILELKLQKERQMNDNISLIKESYGNLLAAIETWKYQYVLTASTNGKVTFNQFWNENQSVKVGEIVMTVIPENEGKIIGKAQLTFQGAGKVKEGQNANIQFANYPYMEFGMVRGVVNTVSLAPDNNYYTVELELPEGLKTFYGVNLDFKQEMQGVAEIITEDKRLLERIMRPFRYVINKNTSLKTD